MTLDPTVRALIEAMEATFPPLDPARSGTETRRLVKEAGEKVIPGAPEPVAQVRGRSIPGPAGDIPVRIYRPAADGPLPVVMFFHGGGFVLCDLDSHDAICRALCNASGMVVVAVDYRLAPEHRYPIPVEDCYAAMAWVAGHAAEVGGDPTRMAVVGDSAGGNLAAVVALMARDRRGPSLAAQALIYPMLDHRMDTASHRELGPGYYLTSEEVRYFWGEYLPDQASGVEFYASPSQADLSGLPPALVVTAEFDPLRDEGEAYGAALKNAGTPATVHRYDGMFHSFFSFLAVLPAASELLGEVADFLRERLVGNRVDPAARP